MALEPVGVDSVQDGNQMSSFDRVVTVTIPREVAFDLNAHRSQVDRPGGSMHSGSGMRVSSIIQPRIRRSFSAGSADRSRNGRWGGWVKGALMTKTALVGLYLAIAIVLPVVGAHADGGWVAIARDGSGYWGYANDYPDSQICGFGGAEGLRARRVQAGVFGARKLLGVCGKPRRWLLGRICIR